MSGLVPTIFYWLAPWLVPSLTPQGQERALWVTLIAALLAIGLGLASRRSAKGRQAVFVGCINLSLWIFFTVVANFRGHLLHQERDVNGVSPPVFLPPSVRVHPEAVTSAEAQLRQELRDAQTRLLEARESYGEQNPKVVRLRESVVAMERAINDVRAHESLELAHARIELDRLSTTFGPSNPKILAQQDKVRMLEQLDGVSSSQPAAQPVSREAEPLP
jgi:hypothetical protein